MPSPRANWPMVLALTLGLAGCRNPPPEPSAAYDQAWRLYANLYARQLDDAFANPSMDQVVTLLKQVPAGSADGNAAKALLARIDDGRKALAKDRVEQAKLRATLTPGPASPQLLAALASAQPPADAGQPAAPPAAAEPVDAGPAAVDPFATGAPIADLNRDSGGCLVASDPFRENGSGKTGETYRLASSSGCQAKLPGLQDVVLLVVDGRIYRRMSAKDVPVPPPPPRRPAAQAPVAPAQPPPPPLLPPAPPPVQQGDIIQPTQPQPTY